MEQITHPSVKEAFAVLKSVSATAEERADAEKRIKYVRDLNAMIGAGWDEGRAAEKRREKLSFSCDNS